MAMTMTTFFLIKLPKLWYKCKCFVISTSFSKKHPHYVKKKRICQDILQADAFRWVRILCLVSAKKENPIRMDGVSFMVETTGLDLHFCPAGKNKGVDPVQPGSSNSPPDCCIHMGSSPPPEFK
jgi:hypothetical protein